MRRRRLSFMATSRNESGSEMRQAAAAAATVMRRAAAAAETGAAEAVMGRTVTAAEAAALVSPSLMAVSHRAEAGPAAGPAAAEGRLTAARVALRRAGEALRPRAG